jgi:hypothetical protein
LAALGVFLAIVNLTRSNDPIVQDFDHETQHREQVIFADQQRAMQQFEKRWAERVIRRYQKPSSRLRQMRVNQLDRLNAGEEEAALQLQTEIEAREAEERQTAEEQYWKDYRNARRRIGEQFAEEISEFRAIRERLRSKLVVRSTGMFTGPFDRVPASKSITAVRPRPFSTMAQRPNDQVLPPLYDAREWTRRPTRQSTTNAETQSGPQPNDEEPEDEGGEEIASALDQDEVQAPTGDKPKDEGGEEIASALDQDEAQAPTGDEPKDEGGEEIASALDQDESQALTGDEPKDEGGEEIASALDQDESQASPGDEDASDVDLFITTGGTARDAEEEEVADELTEAPAPEESEFSAVEGQTVPAAVPEEDQEKPEANEAASGEGQT